MHYYFNHNSTFIIFPMFKLYFYCFVLILVKPKSFKTYCDHWVHNIVLKHLFLYFTKKSTASSICTFHYSKGIKYVLYVCRLLIWIRPNMSNVIFYLVRTNEMYNKFNLFAQLLFECNMLIVIFLIFMESCAFYPSWFINNKFGIFSQNS